MPPRSLPPLPLAVLALWMSPTAGAETWTRVRGPRVEVLSDAGETEAREATARLERLQSVLDRLLPPPDDEASALPAQAPLVRALLVRQPVAVAALVPAQRSDPGSVAGFFVGGSNGPVIVVPAPEEARTGGAAWAVFDHEAVHLHLNRVLPAQPVWVAEGLADVLSGGELDGPVARLGSVRPERLALLRREPLLTMAELLGTGYDSRLYRGEPRTDLLYAESEALVRWVVARHGLPALHSLLAALAAGEPPLPAFVGVFGDPAAVFPALHGTPPGPLLEVPLAGVEPPPLTADPAPAAEVDFRLGDVLLHGGRDREAEGRFRRALQADPRHAAARAGLAELALKKGQWTEAERELNLALQAAPDDASALLRLARLTLAEARERGAGDSPLVEAKAVAALERAVALQPDLAEAAEMLARERPEPLAGRIALLRRAFSRDPGRPELGIMLSALLTRRHDVTAAREVLVRARDAAREPAYRFVCEYRLRQFQGYADRTAEARGRLVHLECRGDGSLRFAVVVGSGRLGLAATSRQSIFVRGPGDSEELQLTCGAQDLPVRVRFVPSLELGRDGSLLTLDALGESD